MIAPSDRVRPAGATGVLEDAARASLPARSVFNARPWRRRTTGDRLELHADTTRRRDPADVITIEQTSGPEGEPR